jgi:hypothetical protein
MNGSAGGSSIGGRGAEPGYNQDATAGTVNRGAGGGGGGSTPYVERYNTTGAAGGSGIVIIRYEV